MKSLFPDSRPTCTLFFFFLMIRRPPRSTLLSLHDALPISSNVTSNCRPCLPHPRPGTDPMIRRIASWLFNRYMLELLGLVALSLLIWFVGPDRKSTRLNSSHLVISYAVFCLKKKKTKHHTHLQ